MEQIPEEIRKIFKGLEDDVIEAILKRMEKIQEIIPASDYQLWRLDQIGSFRSDIREKIRKALGLSKKEIDKIYSETMKENYVRDKRIYEEIGVDQIPYEENEPLQQLISAVKTQPEEEFKNITKTMGFITPSGVKTINKEFTDLMDKALMEVSTGSFDYSTAIRTAVNEMVNSGVRWIDYESGHHNRVDVATRRALMTGVRQVTGKIAEMNAEAMGTDKYEVSAHPTARPDHQIWQGKVYTYEELVSVCGLGTGPGLCGWNCYHFYDPFFEGISVRKYTDEQLEQMNAEANKKAVYDGKEYTKYEATQEQRRLETKMRALREKINLLKKHGGRKEDIQNQQIKYNETMSRYKDFSEKMKLPFQPERIRTSDWSVKYNKLKPITGTSEELKVETSKIYDKWSKDQSIDRNTMTKMFSKDRYYIGEDPITKAKVYVMNKDLSYFISHHGKEMTKGDLLQITELMNYDRLYKNPKGGDNLFYKKSVTGDGYVEGCKKQIEDGDEIFHYQYMGLKSFNKKERNKLKGLLIDNRETS
nr:phage minor capsid protein [Clostridia bacterium]